MKKAIVVLAVVFLSSIAAQAQQGGGAGGMGSGMMGGGNEGMGQGMMGGGGNNIGQEMMGSGYYSQSPECQAFYNDTVQLRKELNEKRFEYFEMQRNPNEGGGKAAEMEKEINELRDKISAKASPGCRW